MKLLPIKPAPPVTKSLNIASKELVKIYKSYLFINFKVINKNKQKQFKSTKISI